MAEINGVIKYNIEHDGCLIGIYTNYNGSNSSDISPEIAKRIEPHDASTDPICGRYECKYISEPENCELFIAPDTNENVYHFKWVWEDGTEHLGIGMKFDRMIVVSYWKD